MLNYKMLNLRTVHTTNSHHAAVFFHFNYF